MGYLESPPTFIFFTISYILYRFPHIILGYLRGHCPSGGIAHCVIYCSIFPPFPIKKYIKYKIQKLKETRVSVFFYLFMTLSYPPTRHINNTLKFTETKVSMGSISNNIIYRKKWRRRSLWITHVNEHERKRVRSEMGYSATFSYI